MTDRQPGNADGDRDEGRSVAEPDVFLVRVTVTRDSAPDLVRRGDFDFGDRPHFKPLGDEVAAIDGLATQATIDELRAGDFDVDVIENVSEVGRERAPEIGVGDRYNGGRVVPRGLGRKVGRPDDGPGDAT
jgi:hypothetical protein